MMHQLQLPVLIEPIARVGYQLQPLLFSGVSAQHKRYARAMDELTKAVQREFQGLQLQRKNLAHLLWYSLAPDLKFKRQAVEIRYGKRWLRGHCAVAFYQLGDHQYACCPKLDHLTILLHSNPTAAKQQLRDAIQSFFRQRHQARDSLLDVESYLSSKHESYTLFETHVAVPHARFPFEFSDLGWYSLAGHTGEIDAAVELNKVGSNLNDLYPNELAQAYLRTELVNLLENMIYQAHPTCLALIGPRGVGKTTVLQAALRQFLDASEKPNSPKLPRLWQVDPLRVITGMSQVGMWERRMQAIIDYLRTRLHRYHRISKTDYLFIDNTVALFRVGKSAHSDLTLADVLKPYLEKRALTMIAEATPEQWRRVQELDRGFADLFEVIRVEPPPMDQALGMLVWQRAQLELSHECCYTSQALMALWALRDRYAGGEVLPGVVIRGLRELAERQRGGRKRGESIDVNDVYDAYQSRHKFRSEWIDPEVALDESALKAHLDARLMGQQAAKVILINVIQQIKARLNDPQRPLAALLFIGPTGVGKTEAAKLLADTLFTDAQQLLRFDMNEYIASDACARLLGDHYQPQGQLTSQIRQRRAGVLLLDEIEKAHPTVHDMLLQVLDEGRLTDDALGQTVDFSQYVIIMTSNLGAQEAQRAQRFGFTHIQPEQQVHSYTQAVERFFRPELLNRVDEQVIFTALEHSHALQLVQLHIERLLGRDGFMRRTTFVSVSADSLEQVATLGFVGDGELGGRALKRAVEQSLTVLAAEQLASLPPEQPLLLNVYAEGRTLKPHIVPLKYAPAHRSHLPTINTGQLPQAFLQLAHAVADLENRINTFLDHPETPSDIRVDWWMLKERLLLLKRDVEDIVWDIEQWQKRGAHALQPLFRVKRRSSLSGEWLVPGSVLSDLAAQLNIDDYIREQCANAVALADLSTPYFIQLWLSERVLRIAVDAQASGRYDYCVLALAPCLDNAAYGNALLAELGDHYHHLLHTLDATDIIVERCGSQRMIFAEGYGLYALLKGETGLHLFIDAARQQQPLQVYVNRLDPNSSRSEQLAQVDRLRLPPPQRPHPGDILRLYRQDSAAGRRTLVDLRSGLLCSGSLSGHDWLLLISVTVLDGLS